MHVPTEFELGDQGTILDVLRTVGFGHLVTSQTGPNPDPDLDCSALPFLVDDELTTLRVHFSRRNPHWNTIDRRRALMIVPTADAYISPRWYPSTRAHGRVVPTWNYEVINIHGTIDIRDDPSWKLDLVSELSMHNEQRLATPTPDNEWHIDDAPNSYIHQRLDQIVGAQFNIERLQARRKLGQNLTDTDRAGAINGLNSTRHPADSTIARLMADTNQSPIEREGPPTDR